jgi:HSP20 family protein
MALMTRRNGPSIIRVSPIREFEDVYDRLGQLMNVALGDPSLGIAGDAPWMPLADLSETDSAYVVEIDLPGVNKDQIDIQLNDRELVVTGRIEEQERGRRHRQTRRTGRFEFRAVLPGEVKADDVRAELHDGVLTVTVPKAQEAKPRHIDISG